MDPQADPQAMPSTDDSNLSQANDNDAAAAFARAKISAIFQEPTAQPSPAPPLQSAQPAEEPAVPSPVVPSPNVELPVVQPPASIYPALPPAAPPPVTEQLYQQETHLQDELQPATPHVAPDHQLPSATPPANFQTFHLPGQTVVPTAPAASASPEPTTAASLITPVNPSEPPTVVTVPPAAPSAPTQQPVSRAEQLKQFAAGSAEKLKTAQQKKGRVLRPLMKSAIVTALVFLIYNAPIVLGQVHYYITPANSSPTPIILDDTSAGSVGAEPKLIISKLNIDVPVVYDETSFDEHKIQAALQRGIVHYGTTALPGEQGNAVFMGHSSNSPWAPGKFKTAFSILRRLEVSDTFVMHFQGQRYIYEVFDKHIIDPSDFSVLDQNVSEPVVTLITCDPPGVNWRRLAIQARQISPDPKKADKPSTTSNDLPSSGDLPGSPPSLYDRIRDWIF